MGTQADIDKLLARTTLKSDAFEDFLDKLQLTYPLLGRLEQCHPLTDGYEDANFALITTSGKYVLKIFASDMSIVCARAHARALQIANEVTFPAPAIIQNSSGGYLSGLFDQFVLITKFIEGSSFDSRVPTLKDMLALTRELTKLNVIQERLKVSYDSWGNSELLWEYKRDKDNLSGEILRLLEPTIQKLRRLDTSGFRAGLIHGDIQPKHVFSDKNGSYHILDLGVARYDLLVYELSTHLAWFCLPKTGRSEWQDTIRAVIEAYEERIVLTPKEKISLPTLIEAAYAAYYFRTSVLIALGDKSKETVDWNNKATGLLITSRELFAKN